MTGKLGRFICPHCQAINVEMGYCKKCGTNLETGETPGSEEDGEQGHDGQSLRDMQTPGLLSKRQIIIGGAGLLLVISAAMMYMGGKPAPPPPAAGTTAASRPAPATTQPAA